MKDERKTKEQLINELAELRQRVAELEAADAGRLSAEQAGKRSEESLKEFLKQIERAKQEWESTVDSIPELVCLVDDRGRIVRANQTVETWNLGRVVDVKGWGVHELLHPGCVDGSTELTTGSSCYLDSFWKGAWEEAVRGQSAQCEAYDKVLERHVLVQVQPWKGRAIGSTVVVVRDITERKQVEEKLRQSYVKLQRTLEATVKALVSAVEMRDPYTAGHQRRVAQLACAVANGMGLPEEQIEGIRMAGLIHDIGKLNVPAEILSKPGRLSEIELSLVRTHPQVGHDILNVPGEILGRPGLLTEIEFGLIKAHPQLGYDVLKTIEFPWPVAEIVLQHHERMDGSGYPQGLSGDNILPEARILGVADVVEAMTFRRPYRPARGIEKALEEISQNRGVLYNAEVVDACLKLFTEKGFAFE
ncbi:MAG: HD domain-containing phosphohydrolase [Anaerolineae bacterium]